MREDAGEPALLEIIFCEPRGRKDELGFGDIWGF